MDTRQVCILIVVAIVFMPFLCGLIEELIKEHVEKNKAIKRQNMELKSVLEKMVEAQEYKVYKINFAKAMRNL